jgi:hypothetical protein
VHGDVWGLCALRPRWGLLFCYYLLSCSFPVWCDLAVLAWIDVFLVRLLLHR